VPATHDEMLTSAGFVNIEAIDVTGAFSRIQQAMGGRLRSARTGTHRADHTDRNTRNEPRPCPDIQDPVGRTKYRPRPIRSRAIRPEARTALRTLMLAHAPTPCRYGFTTACCAAADRQGGVDRALLRP
jgi:hypothetical protein